MLFNTIRYVFFFAALVPIYYCIPQKWKNVFLLICSYVFYMCWNVKYSLLLLFSTSITYLGGRMLNLVSTSGWQEEKCSRCRKWLVTAVIASNLLILAFFKYFYFFFDTLEAAVSLFGLHLQGPTVQILLPVGISFYIFQALGYLIDCYRGTIAPEQSFIRYALFVSFFPQLVAGPIERSGNLLGQFREPVRFDYKKVRHGFLIMLWGFVLKSVIADRLSIIVDTIYWDPSAYPGMYLLVATVLFAFQIYCDFAGYSTIAIGSAQVLGISLMENFNAPYFSQSVAEFWRRWHISLSTWFRDYLYIPLGGNRKGIRRKYVNLMITFAVSGLWHGAQWSFVIWGLLNGAFQVIDACTKSLRQKLNRRLQVEETSFSHRLLRCLITFVLIDFSWIFFRAADVQQAFYVISSIIHMQNVHILFDRSLLECGLDSADCNVLVLYMVLLTVIDYLKYKKINVFDKIERQAFWFRWIVYLFLILSTLVLGQWGGVYNAASFVYFQF